MIRYCCARCRQSFPQALPERGPYGDERICDGCEAARTAIPGPEALALLEAIGRGEITILPLDNWHDIYAGNVRYRTSNGWEITVFNDCDSWDYLDSLTAPDGRHVEYQDLCDDVRNWRPSDDAGLALWRPTPL